MKRNAQCTCSVCSCNHERRGEALGIAVVVIIVWILLYAVGV